ncbi:glycoside hydrolase family 113 [Paenibacillus herberti]|uniref:Hydrolase n=1 Tax=Paenibacillus herberti TaxID=1619309 RepID=A0A229P3A5_9BACL|nr:hypothetical protein [Paenibacillus herberti]OXM16531.1 hydrolase [Paenibacillus herberti]
MAGRMSNFQRTALKAVCLIVVASAIVWWSGNERATDREPERRSLLQGEIRSGNLSTDYTIEQALADAKQLSLNAVNVPVAVNIGDLTASDFELDSASLEKAKELIPKLHARGLRVLLEPYPWIAEGSEVETKWAPGDGVAFFQNWSVKVLQPLLSELAEPMGVEAVIIASNLVHMEDNSEEWIRLLKEARRSYSGLITYKTNWWYTASWDEDSRVEFQRKRDNPLWGEVDFISVAAYFELTDRPVNTVDELAAALRRTEINAREQDVVAELEEMAELWDKPFYFAELGFPAREYAAREPWNPSPSEKVDGAEQARLFGAYQEVFHGRSSFLGYSVFAIGENSSDKHYYPSEESAAVIRSW